MFIMTGDGNPCCTFSADMIRVILVGCLNRKSPVLKLFWHLNLRGIIQSEIGEKERKRFLSESYIIYRR